MKLFITIVLFTIILSLNGFSQVKFPIEYRIEKQSMSTPMSVVEDIFFGRTYYAKPVNVKFDGSYLSMYFDNGATCTSKNVTKVNHEVEYEDDALAMETFYYTDNTNVSDTILLVVDYNVRYVQMILPAKNSKGEKIGYTSYRKFMVEDELALN